MHSLKRRLALLSGLLAVAAIAAGTLMVGLFFSSASGQAAQAADAIGRACDAIGAAYRFYGAGWSGPASLDASGLRAGLTTVLQTALHDRAGIEGGLWQADVGSMAYAYPTYQGAEPKLDVPAAEVTRIAAVNSAAQGEDRPVGWRYPGRSEVLLLAACPLPGPIPRLSAWTMTRVVTFAGRAYGELMAGLAVLLSAVAAATTLLIRLTIAWSRHVARIEDTLQAADVQHLPQIDLTGERELDRIIDALNLAGRRLAETRARAEALARQVAAGERLAAIGRVAAGVAHEIRNPIAAMRLKAENALAGDARRKDEALTMIVGQIERLDRLLRRLLSLTERDAPRRRPVSLGELVTACIADHEELAAAKDLRFTAQLDVETATVDADQMRRALDNLVLNAIEAAPVRSMIRVSARREAASLVLAVHDEGGGPPPALRDHLFEPFVTGRPDGTGLGLSLVREIAVAHGGDARLAAQPPGSVGSTFELVIPWQ